MALAIKEQRLDAQTMNFLSRFTARFDIPRSQSYVEFENAFAVYSNTVFMLKLNFVK